MQIYKTKLCVYCISMGWNAYLVSEKCEINILVGLEMSFKNHCY